MKNLMVAVLGMMISLPLLGDAPIKIAKEAIRHRRINVLNQLLESQAIGPNDFVKKDITLLGYAVSQSYNGGQDPDDVDGVVSALLAHGANPNQVSMNHDWYGRTRRWETPLLTAMYMDRPGAVNLLLADSRTDVNVVICDQKKNFKKPIGTVLEFAYPGSVSATNLLAHGALPYDPATMKCE
jgi:hypothetical protein